MTKTEAFTVTEIVFSSIPVRAETHWYFVEVSDPDGITGVAEFTHGGQSLATAQTMAEMAGEIRGQPIEDEASLPVTLGLAPALLQSDRVIAAAVTGLRSAILDGQAQRAGISLREMLAGDESEVPDSVELYANINRSMLPDDSGPVDRSPEAFADMAGRAVEEGFRTIKCAPFDECRAPFDAPGLPPEAADGLARIAAVRDAIGPDATLLVDCHSRFDLESALALEPELAALGVGWFEEPVSYRDNSRDLTRITAASSMPVAGAETGYGIELFESLIADRVVDVVMPDAKYCGGVGEAVRIGRSLEASHPGSISMHSPSGPISLLASAHATAAFAGSRPLEHAISEVDWRATTIDPAEHVHDGRLYLPSGPGLGAGLNQSLISQNGRRWTI
ncbi:MAG: mandelate racemase/muconate lactonizing enzyme family protein [Chloroflexi bacterium]|nr:mandelate racemase/muconate lactonizing enzyme family protein [Chloroflexota bacterium]